MGRFAAVVCGYRLVYSATVVSRLLISHQTQTEEIQSKVGEAVKWVKNWVAWQEHRV